VELFLRGAGRLLLLDGDEGVGPIVEEGVGDDSDGEMLSDVVDGADVDRDGNVGPE